MHNQRQHARIHANGVPDALGTRVTPAQALSQQLDPVYVGLGSKPEVLFNDYTSAFTSSGHATALA
jgi:hypothetical protein